MFTLGAMVALPLPGTEIALSYVFIRDAFLLSENIKKPYSQKNNTRNDFFIIIYTRLGRVVENAFGIITSRFGVFQRYFSIKLQNMDAKYV